MRLKSIAALKFYVADVNKTAAFYEGLGFITTKKDESQYSMRLNWFTVDFIKQNRKVVPSTDQAVCINVDDVDAFHDEIVEKGYEVGEQPHDTPAGRREFLMADPDGYQLVFFQKK
jgi:predicted enzyme related to lactoylglutathione lyase